MRKAAPELTLSLLTAWLALVGLQLSGATYKVAVDGSGFSPASLTINVGDTVVWINLDDTFSHTTTSDLPATSPNYWDGVLIDFFDTFAQQFNSVGQFTYHDQLDIGTGTIIVAGNNTPPSVSITNPQPNAVLSAPA